MRVCACVCVCVCVCVCALAVLMCFGCGISFLEYTASFWNLCTAPDCRRGATFAAPAAVAQATRRATYGRARGQAPADAETGPCPENAAREKDAGSAGDFPTSLTPLRLQTVFCYRNFRLFSFRFFNIFSSS